MRERLVKFGCEKLDIIRRVKL